MSEGRRRGWNLSGVALMLLLGGCGAPRSETTELRQKTTALEAQLAEVQIKLDALESQLNEEIVTTQLMRDQFSSAFFDPAAANEGFLRLDTSVGSFAVSLQEVAPYADGVKVRFHVGNLGAATINGATFKVKWGSRMPESGEGFSTKYPAWKKALREKEVQVVKGLKSGTWNNVSLMLPGTKPADFGYLELSMQTSQIILQVER